MIEQIQRIGRLAHALAVEQNCSILPAGFYQDGVCIF
jgi:hypothetical protein